MCTWLERIIIYTPHTHIISSVYISHIKKNNQLKYVTQYKMIRYNKLMWSFYTLFQSFIGGDRYIYRGRARVGTMTPWWKAHPKRYPSGRPIK